MSYGGPSNQPWQRNVMPFQNAASQQMYMPTQPSYGQGGMYGGSTVQSYGSQTYKSMGTVTKINNECGLVNDEIFFYLNACFKGQIPKIGDRVMFEAAGSTTGQFKWNATRIQLMQNQGVVASGMGAGNMNNDHKAQATRYGNVPPTDYRNVHQDSPLAHRRPSPVRQRSFRTERRESERRESERREPKRDHPVRRSRDREDIERDRKRRREERSRDRDREDRTNLNRSTNATRTNRDEGKRERDQSVERKERERKERDREKALSPSRRQVRGGRRYAVHIPKHSLVCNDLSIIELRQRYPSLYVPSYFFHVSVLWPETFTPDKPFSLRRSCKFHIMHDTVEPLTETKKEDLEPRDADYSYSAKVMLLACPSLSEIYQKCFENGNEQNPLHLTRLIRFLVGMRGSYTPIAIGGTWSPSLDGPNPGKDPAVLIRTAIRTCKALTSIDLSNCTQWYRFCEFNYLHENEKDPSAPLKMETVVIYIPDVHSCMPSIDDYKKLTLEYGNAADRLIERKVQQLAAANNNKTASNNENDTSKTEEAADTQQQGSIKDITVEENQPEAPGESSAKEAIVDITADGDDTENEKEIDTVKPTHYSELDVKSMKVQEIRDELIARKLPEKGVRNIILSRLVKAIAAEKEEEEKAKKEAELKANEQNNSKNEDNDDDDDDVQIIEDDDEEMENANDSTQANEQDAENEEEPISGEVQNDENDEQEEWADVDMNDIVILDEYDSSKNPEENQPKEMTEREKEKIIRHYTLKEEPSIIVHPNRSAKNGKFDCSIMSLSNLLDYRPNVSKQRNFEVAIFSELFKEMLTRDFAFNIYKEIYIHNETTKTEESSAEAKENNDAAKNDENNSQKDETKTTKDNNNASDNKSEDTPSVKTSNKRKTTTGGEHRDKDKEKETTNGHANMVTVKPHLLLSFLYFDSSQSGYILKRDLEEIFYLCGLSLSRAQVQKFLDKLESRQSITYRRLTDKEVGPDTVPTIEDIDDTDNEMLKKIAMGNFALFEEEAENGSETLDGNTEDAQNNGGEHGLINYNGTVVHVGKLMDQIKRTEKSFSDMETLYNDLRKDHNDLQKTHSKSSGKIKDLQSEVKDLAHKLSVVNRDYDTVNRKQKDQFSTISLVYHRLQTIVEREKKEAKKKESSRSDKSKDRTTDKGKESSKKEKPEKDKSKEGDENDKKSTKKNDETKTTTADNNADKNNDENKSESDIQNADEDNSENMEAIENNDDEKNGEEKK